MRSTDRDMPESEFSKLTDEELVKLIQGGDDDALEYIFRKYKKLFESRAERYFLPGGGDRQDLGQNLHETGPQRPLHDGQSIVLRHGGLPAPPGEDSIAVQPVIDL